MTEARPRVLVVDDDRAVLSMLLAGLSRAGFDTVVVTNSDEARRMVVEARPALAIFDAQMEGGRGFELARYLRNEAHVRFVVLAPIRDEVLRRQAAACGAAAVVTKPVDMARLVPVVREALQAAPEPRPAGRPEDLLTDTLGGGHGPQALIAVGILAERHRVNCDEAVRILHERAAAAGVPLDEFSLAVIEQAEGAARKAV
jgi:DNA-binding response OmpR family regulator